MEGCQNTCHRALPRPQGVTLDASRSCAARSTIGLASSQTMPVISKRRGYRPPLGDKRVSIAGISIRGRQPPQSDMPTTRSDGTPIQCPPTGPPASVYQARHRPIAVTRSPANQLRLGTSLTPSLYAGLGENRSMDLIDLLLGRPLATEEEKAERIGPVKGIPIFGLDALSSAAYGPEAALTLLIPLGMAGVAYIVPISISIIFLLAIVYFSYRQTIMAYPQGGGSYTVASENLGVWPGLHLTGSANGEPKDQGNHRDRSRANEGERDQCRFSHIVATCRSGSGWFVGYSEKKFLRAFRRAHHFWPANAALFRLVGSYLASMLAGRIDRKSTRLNSSHLG